MGWTTERRTHPIASPRLVRSIRFVRSPFFENGWNFSRTACIGGENRPVYGYGRFRIVKGGFVKTREGWAFCRAFITFNNSRSRFGCSVVWFSQSPAAARRRRRRVYSSIRDYYATTTMLLLLPYLVHRLRLIGEVSFWRRRVVVAETDDASGVRVFVRGEDDEIDGDGTLEGVGDETTIEGPGVGTTRASRDVIERRGDVDDGDAGSALALGESSRFETVQNSIPGSGSAEFNLPGRFVAKACAEIGR